MADRATLVLVPLIDNFGHDRKRIACRDVAQALAMPGSIPRRCAVQRGRRATRRGLQTVTKHSKPAIVAIERRCTLVALATVRNLQRLFESFEI
jgi:hypothetical protein